MSTDNQSIWILQVFHCDDELPEVTLHRSSDSAIRYLVEVHSVIMSEDDFQSLIDGHTHYDGDTRIGLEQDEVLQ